MFAFLDGQIDQIEPSGVILLVHGIGFRLKVGNPYQFKIGDTVRFYTHLVVSDTELILYGFSDFNELILFEKLLKVSGIGPKSAHVIVASKDAKKLSEAVENNDIKMLTRFPGVGKRTAQQIILDLKGKLDNVNSLQTQVVLDPEINQNLRDAKDALMALGYTEKEVNKVVKLLFKEKKELSTQEYLKKGLNILTER